ncbi:MAG: biotin/lipoyl-binding protein, partial [Anaerolineales bacterium]|nr:biotin/lipoyl-binding protein [Anaerolineales bacterium]
MKPHFLKRTLWILLSVAIVLAGAGGYAYYRVRQTQASNTQTSTLQTATVRQGDLVIRASGTGTLIAVTESDLVFGTSGKLENILVKVGDKVEAGQLLAQLDDSSQQIKLAQAKQTLLELTSPAAIAATQQSVAQTQKDVYNAQVALNNLNIGVNEALLINAEASLTLALRQEEKAQEAYDKVAHMSHDESQWA